MPTSQPVSRSPERRFPQRLREGLQPPPLLRVGSTKPPTPNPTAMVLTTEMVLTTSQLLSPPPSALSAASLLPPSLLHPGLGHHCLAPEAFLGRPLRPWPWFLGPGLGAVKPSFPLGSRGEAWPVAPLLPPTLLPFSVGLSPLSRFLPRVLPIQLPRLTPQNPRSFHPHTPRTSP